MNERYCYMDDISNGLEKLKIPYVNDYNDLKLPVDIQYVTSCILGSPSCAEDFDSLPAPCDCTDNCISNCSCTYDGNAAYQNEILKEEYVNEGTLPIIECSKYCACKTFCENSVVQKGIRFQLQVFMTHSKGFGVRTLQHIPKLAFVCEYAGEIIDTVEIKERTKKRSSTDPNYIYVLNEHFSSHKCKVTIIDPTTIGNVGRYLNHSCSPNLIPVPIRASSIVPRICFFAKEDISPHQELSYNYAEHCFNEDRRNSSSDSLISSNRKCHCRSSKCNGFLPFDSKWLCS